MEVNETAEALSAAERTTTILTAACRAIAKAGSRKLNLANVAREAGVSKALIHYYFDSREDLVAQAYRFADQRARERIRAQVGRPESAAVRIKQLLLMYLIDDAEVREDWILWSELSANAVFEEELRPTMTASFSTWTAWMEALIREAIDDGSIAANTDITAAALRLTALVDGLGSHVIRGLITHARAREILSRGVELELGMATHDDHAEPATGYLRHLASLTKQAINELEALASSADERSSIQAVSDLIDRVSGGAALVAQKGCETPVAPLERTRRRRSA